MDLRVKKGTKLFGVDLRGDGWSVWFGRYGIGLDFHRLEGEYLLLIVPFIYDCESDDDIWSRHILVGLRRRDG